MTDERKQVIVCHPSDAQNVRKAAIELGREDVHIRSHRLVEKGECYLMSVEPLWLEQSEDYFGVTE